MFINCNFLDILISRKKPQIVTLSGAKGLVLPTRSTRFSPALPKAAYHSDIPVPEFLITINKSSQKGGDTI